MPAELRTLRRIPIAAAGNWDTQVGDGTFDRDFLNALATASKDPLVRDARLTLGHTVRKNADGTVEQIPRPTVGHVDNLTVDDDTLYGDLHLPAWLADVAEVATPGRSIEAWRDYTTAAGDRYDGALTVVALLSDELPAVDTLEDLKDLWARNTAPAAPDTVEDAAPVAASRLVVCALPTQLPSDQDGDHNNEQEANVPDVNPDAPEAPETEPEAAVQPDTPPTQPTEPAKPDIPDGFVLMEEGKVNEIYAKLAQFDQFLATKRDEDATEFADQLVAAGKIAPTSRDKIVAEYKADPARVKAVTDLLPEQTIPTGSLTAASRIQPPADTPTDDDFPSIITLTPAERARLGDQE